MIPDDVLATAQTQCRLALVVPRAIKTKQHAQPRWQRACPHERRPARDLQEHAVERSRGRCHQGREHQLRHRFSRRSDKHCQTRVWPQRSNTREKETQDSSKSVAELWGDIGTIQFASPIFQNFSEVKNSTSLQKKIDTRIVDSDAEALTAVTDAAAFSSADEPKSVDLEQRTSMS